jgi:transposase
MADDLEGGAMNLPSGEFLSVEDWSSPDPAVTDAGDGPSLLDVSSQTQAGGGDPVPVPGPFSSTLERNAAVVRAYKAGATTRQLAARFGIAHSLVARIIRRDAPEARRPVGVRGWSPEQRARAADIARENFAKRWAKRGDVKAEAVQKPKPVPKAPPPVAKPDPAPKRPDPIPTPAQARQREKFKAETRGIIHADKKGSGGDDDAVLVAKFIAERGVTRCPTAYVEKVTGAEPLALGAPPEPAPIRKKKNRSPDIRNRQASSIAARKKRGGQ